MQKKYFIVTFGCQMNVHESEKLAGILRSRGYEEGKSEEEADIVVFNTCCIRENAENTAYGHIGALKKLKKAKPDMLIAVGGCMTQQKDAAEKLQKTFPFVDIIFGTHNLEELGVLMDKRLSSKSSIVDIWEKAGDINEEDIAYRTGYPNAWVNIMYGCNNFCTYCIVPKVRGKERSRSIDAIVQEVYGLLDKGYKEITLLGQNVNSYGNGKDENFAKLLERICQRKDKFRLRFMTSHPKDFNEELIQVIAKYPQICNLIHLPVQAGANRVLKMMGRQYTREEYLAKVALLRKYIANAELTTDLMVGFPNETEEDFLQTLQMVEEADFLSAFTFVYSVRSGTPAAMMKGHLPEEVKKDRIMRLVALVNEKTRKKAKDYQDKVIEILVEGFDEKKGLYYGRDEFGRMGYFADTNNDVIGEFIQIKVQKTAGIAVEGVRL